MCRICSRSLTFRCVGSAVVQDVFRTLDFQDLGPCVGCVGDARLAGVWVWLVCRACSGLWTFKCMGTAGIYGVLGALDFQVYGMAIVQDVFRTLDFQVYG